MMAAEIQPSLYSMPDIAPLDLQLHPEVRQVVSSFMSRVRVPEATLCFIKGRASGDSHESWMLGAYFPEDLAEIETLGKPILYSVDDLVIAIPRQAEELAGKAIRWANGRLVVTGRNPDA